LLFGEVISRLITTADDSKVSQNNSIKLDDFPTVKYNTDQLKERVIRIGMLLAKLFFFNSFHCYSYFPLFSRLEQQDLSRVGEGNSTADDSVEHWKSQLFASQTKYNTLKLFVDDMIFGLGFS
jgi:hypothetical protein